MHNLHERHNVLHLYTNMFPRILHNLLCTMEEQSSKLFFVVFLAMQKYKPYTFWLTGGLS